LVAGEIIEIQPNLVETKTTRKKGAQRAKKGKFSPLLPHRNRERDRARIRDSIEHDEPNDNTVTCYSQNVQGIFESMKDKNGNPIAGERSYWKLEYIISMMETDKIDIYLLWKVQSSTCR